MVKAYYKANKYEVRRSIGHLMRVAFTQVTTQVEAIFQEKDISFVQYMILMYLRDGMAKTPADLCQRIRYDSGALTRVLDQLEERALLTRTRCKEDRRVVKLHITPQGVTVAESLMPLVIDLYNGWLTDFTVEEADTLILLLTKLNDAIPAASAKKE